MLATVDHPPRGVGDFTREQILEQAAPVRIVERLLLLELARGDGRHERIRVDLSVWMMQRHTHLDAAVLEREHVVHVVACAERFVAIGPDVDDERDAIERETAERRGRILREHDHFAGAAAWPGLDD